MLNIFKKARKLANTKLLFNRPKNKKVLIFDRSKSKFLKIFFKQEDIFVLDTRVETINLFIIFKVLLSGKIISYRNYLKTYIKIVNPKLVITFIDNNYFFYELKKTFPSKFFISVQNGMRHITNEDIKKLTSLKSKSTINYQIDKFLVLSSAYAKEFSKYIDGDFLTIGSLKNNCVPINHNYQKGKICYISKFVECDKEYIECKDISLLKKRHNKAEIVVSLFKEELVKNLKIYCENNNLELRILGSNDKDIQEEENYFYKILGKGNWIFSPKQDDFDSYKKIDNCEIVVNAMSTLGLEAIARKKKVAFFYSDEVEGSNFGWPIIKQKRDFFFSNSNVHDEIKRIIDNLRSINNDEWSKLISKYSKLFFFYDNNNSQFKKILKDLDI